MKSTAFLQLIITINICFNWLGNFHVDVFPRFSTQCIFFRSSWWWGQLSSENDTLSEGDGMTRGETKWFRKGELHNIFPYYHVMCCRDKITDTRYIFVIFSLYRIQQSVTCGWKNRLMLTNVSKHFSEVVTFAMWKHLPIFIVNLLKIHLTFT